MILWLMCVFVVAPNEARAGALDISPAAAYFDYAHRGLRIIQNIYTPLEEIDTFVAAMQNVLKNCLPA